MPLSYELFFNLHRIAVILRSTGMIGAMDTARILTQSAFVFTHPITNMHTPKVGHGHTNLDLFKRFGRHSLSHVRMLIMLRHMWTSIQKRVCMCAQRSFTHPFTDMHTPRVGLSGHTFPEMFKLHQHNHKAAIPMLHEPRITNNHAGYMRGRGIFNLTGTNIHIHIVDHEHEKQHFMRSPSCINTHTAVIPMLHEPQVTNSHAGYMCGRGILDLAGTSTHMLIMDHRRGNIC